MKTFVRSILISGLLAIGATGLTAAQVSNTWFDQWYKAKYGRSAPAEARRTGEAAAPSRSWAEQWYRVKYGRSTPAQERTDAALGEKTARETPESSARARTWLDQWHRAKFGRDLKGR